MLRVDYTVTYGEVRVKNHDDSKTLTVKIHPANALCAFIYHYQIYARWSWRLSNSKGCG